MQVKGTERKFGLIFLKIKKRKKGKRKKKKKKLSARIKHFLVLLNTR